MVGRHQLRFSAIFLLACLMILDDHVGFPKQSPYFLVVGKYQQPTCTTGNGGDVINAAFACAHEKPRVLNGQYMSADTLALGIRGMCVTPSSMFFFHSARIVGTNIIGNEGNEILAKTYGKWPRLLEYLESRGVFQNFNFIQMSGLDLSRFGVPLC